MVAELQVEGNASTRFAPALRTKSLAVLAEGVGTALLLAIVVGSGIMGERLAAGNAAVALLANSMATGAGLYVLISLLGSISGAHFNPVVTLLLWRRGFLPARRVPAYIASQLLGAIAGVWLAHAMFDLSILQVSTNARSGVGQWLSEVVATSGLLTTILLGLRNDPKAVPALVGAYIAAAYWFTASTSFANPAVAIARALTNTFAGIRPADVPEFICAQFVAMLLVLVAVRFLSSNPMRSEAAND